jgi:uncharacterized protein (AIM24 family)
MESSLQQFAETSNTDSFALQSSKLLKVRLDQVTVQAKLGSMVAYQGDVRFEHAGAGGVGRFIKKAMTGEGTQLMKISGSGEVFLADTAQDVHILRLENERVTCNGRNVLAFDAGISWDIQRVQGGAAGALAGGLFNMTLEGSGYVALITDGPPVLLDVASAPTFADAQAAVAWSGSVTTSLKTDVSLKTMIGRGSGETFQVGFAGTGWVLVQPSEGQFVATTK